MIINQLKVKFCCFHSQCTVQLFPDGLVTLDVVQYINNISSEQILKRSVSALHQFLLHREWILHILD